VILLAKKAEKEEEKPKAVEEKSHKTEKEEKHSHKTEKKEEKPAKKEKDSKEENKEEKKEKQEKEEKKDKEEEEKEHKEKKQDKGKDHEHREEKAEHKEKPAEETHRRKPKKAKHAKREFVELKPAEINEAIVHLANEGHSASEIGMVLRDQYGIPKVGKATGKKLGAILKEHKLAPAIPEDLMSLIKKSVLLRSHMEKNKKDTSAKRGLMLTVSKIRALEKYYKKSGKLPMQWRYSPETAALLAK